MLTVFKVLWFCGFMFSPISSFGHQNDGRFHGFVVARFHPLHLSSHRNDDKFYGFVVSFTTLMVSFTTLVIKMTIDFIVL